jgi:hypothetical protein
VLSIISKNITTYCFLQNKKIFILVITSFKGWGMSLFLEPYFLAKEKKLYFLLSSKKSYSNFLSIIFLGFQRGYFQYLKLRGIGYK